VTDEPDAAGEGEETRAAAWAGGAPVAAAAGESLLDPDSSAGGTAPLDADAPTDGGKLFDADSPPAGATLFDADSPRGSSGATRFDGDPPAAGATLLGADPQAIAPALRARPPLAAMPSGVDVGTFVHRVLEAIDFAAPDLDAEIACGIAAVRARRPFEIGDPAVVIAGLRAAIETPLGPAFDGLRLRDVARADRLDELTFELPLAGGDEPAGRFSPAALGAVLREHLEPGDPLRGYADRLADPDLRRGVRGYLTGSLDLVVRRGDAFLVIDYKTNWLAAPGEELTAWHHRPAALAAEMERAHYGLQALLYLAALHRYLRWRLPTYDPDRNLAGAAYLFLRGMTGPDTPLIGGAPCGVFTFKPRGPLVEAISDLLDEGGDA
jgi:exodeoxyribonuclease V beta subunit